LEVRSLIETSGASPVDEYRILRAPTPPAPLKSIYPEWAPSDFLVLSMPSNDALTNPSLSNLYVDITKNAVRFTNVMILVEEDKPGSINTLLRILNRANLGRYVNRGDYPCIRILPLPFQTKWIRDFGPLFGLAQRDEPCLVDAIYGDVRVDVTRNLDDEVPAYIGVFLYGTGNTRLHVVRPPLELWGGDFQTDGRRNAFCSTETIIMNGGDRQKVDEIMQLYYGIKKVVYLRPLPGQTIKHIDMFMKVVDENNVLVGSFDTSLVKPSSAYEQYLIKEAAVILDQDAACIAREFPGKKIIRMPMPPPILQVKREARLTLYEQMLITAGRQRDSVNSLPDSLLAAEALSLYRRTHSHDAATATEKNLLAHFADTLLRSDPQACALVYRTYLNSVFINGQGGRALMVPAYEGCAEIEREVERLYRALYPATEIFWTNCDEIITQYGALHCITSAIPRFTKK
jgi:agmatine/peptidylarginine deiminase